MPVALAFTLFPAEVLARSSAAPTSPAPPALAIGAWVLPLYALTGLLEQTNLALGGERRRAAVAWTTLGAMTVLAFLLVPRLGAVGAALTSVAGFALALALYAARLRRRIRLGDVFRPLLRVGAAGGALALFWLARRAWRRCRSGSGSRRARRSTFRSRSASGCCGSRPGWRGWRRAR